MSGPFSFPGVFVEEIDTGNKPIEGVPTSTCGFVGITERGPVQPALIGSFGEYLRTYGGYLKEGGRYLAYGVEGFFQNGGARCFVARVVSNGSATKAASAKLNGMKVTAVGPGKWGKNIAVKISAATLDDGTAATRDFFKLTVIYWSAKPSPVIDPSDSANNKNPNRVEPKVLEVYDNLTPAKNEISFYERRVNDSSALVTLKFTAAGRPANRRLTFFAGGNDGAAIDATDFTDALSRLEKINEIALLCCPDENDFPPITAALIAQCETLKDRFAILQAPHPAPAPANHHPPQASKYAAYYYPWLRIKNSINQLPMEIPSGGHIAGIYARTDLERGVHKAPANEIIHGLYLDPHDPAAGLTVQVTKAEQELLNPRGVNVLRYFTAKGNLVWGARTTSPDPDWKYVNVRRLFIFVEASIEQGTRWVVFEPNDEPLWARARQSVSTFLRRLWMNGMLQGKTEKEAYFVRCDRTTMTQDDIDNGRLIVLIGMAPIKPAEFVIFRIGQWAGGSAHRIKAVAKWDDLVLAEEQLRALHDIASHVRERATVIKERGFPERDSRGSGITALFAGASGTGKSMAAEVLANELGLDLYRIDLSAVVSKYIGETEKNLKRLFDAAEKGGAILFFDEADALFGKRSEVKDSHDRFANIEINYFLQRLDHYRGLVILATKVKSDLDEAFLRRLRFVVNFPDADAADRA